MQEVYIFLNELSWSADNYDHNEDLTKKAIDTFRQLISFSVEKSHSHSYGGTIHLYYQGSGMRAFLNDEYAEMAEDKALLQIKQRLEKFIDWEKYPVHKAADHFLFS
ncbi:MAG: hypothetical protein HC880_21405 [Bacteroidia bacterium]|nr:hypothetical protein [Bacteroidia bacterium]